MCFTASEGDIKRGVIWLSHHVWNEKIYDVSDPFYSLRERDRTDVIARKCLIP